MPDRDRVQSEIVSGPKWPQKVVLSALVHADVRARVPDFCSDAIKRSASVDSFDILHSFEAKAKLVQRSV